MFNFDRIPVIEKVYWALCIIVLPIELFRTDLSLNTSFVLTFLLAATGLIWNVYVEKYSNLSELILSIEGENVITNVWNYRHIISTVINAIENERLTVPSTVLDLLRSGRRSVSFGIFPYLAVLLITFYKRL